MGDELKQLLKKGGWLSFESCDISPISQMTANFSPKLRDKIQNGKPGFEATIDVHMQWFCNASPVMHPCVHKQQMVPAFIC